MKTKSVVLGLAFLAFQAAHASDGDRGGNGGDPCENKIKTIGLDIDSWIAQGGPELSMPKLDLSQSSQVGLNYAQYGSEMRAAITAAHIGCVGPGDHEYPVLVGNSQKTCKNLVDSSGMSRIICDRNLFKDLSPNEQYTLVHHEYAGLAGIELPNGDSSNYPISNQIAANLQDEVVKKLVVSTHNCERVPRMTEIVKSSYGSVIGMSQAGAVAYCRKQSLRLPTAKEWAYYAQCHGAQGVTQTAMSGQDKVDSEETRPGVLAARLNPTNQGYYKIYDSFSLNYHGSRSFEDQEYGTFYYSYVGYKTPADDKERNAFWSSSLAASNQGIVYSFHGDSGEISEDWVLNSHNAVRCVIDDLAIQD